MYEGSCWCSVIPRDWSRDGLPRTSVAGSRPRLPCLRDCSAIIQCAPERWEGNCGERCWLTHLIPHLAWNSASKILKAWGTRMDGSSARLLSRLWFLTIAAAAIAVLYAAKVLFLPLAFAVLFAFLLSPVVAALERLRLPRTLASVLVILSFATLVGVGAWTLFTQLVSVANDLPTYRSNIEEKMAAIHSPSDSAFSRARREVEKLSDQLGIVNASPSPEAQSNDKGARKPLGASPQHPIQVRDVSRNDGRLDHLSGVLEPLTTAALSAVFTFFVLLQREDLRNRLIRLSGDRNLTMITQAMHDASRRISRYFSLQLSVNVVYGLTFAAALYFIGLPHALLFGTLAGLCRFIPYIGPPVAALMPTVLSLAVFPGWSRGLLILGIFAILEVITANYVEPRIYGRHTGLSALAILVAAAFWTLLWGPVGLVLSVPLTVCLVVMGRHVPSLEFLAVMLGDKPAIPTWMCFYQRLLARDEREASEILDKALKERTLAEAYDSVMIPALALAEEDRMHGELDEGTTQFVHRAVQDLIEEQTFGEGAEEEKSVRPLRVMCVPVLDKVDELAAMMLAQTLENGKVHAFAVPPRRLGEMMNAVTVEGPDVVFLTALPPVGIGRLQRLYRGLRMRSPKVKVMIGIWNYPSDARAAAEEIAGGEDLQVLTRLSDAAAEVRQIAGGDAAPLHSAMARSVA
ncbi:AI-2E family transporter [Acidobacteria bacterium AB60]|nr:AI-2E family transporter [Acidobacteria bacterium AB60]